jgi:hypothetical protein
LETRDLRFETEAALNLAQRAEGPKKRLTLTLLFLVPDVEGKNGGKNENGYTYGGNDLHVISPCLEG